MQHGSEEEKDQFVAAVRAGGRCDLRGVAVDRELVRALTAETDEPTRSVAFDGLSAEHAVFLDEVDFSGCRFIGETVFDGAVFRAHASFDDALFDDAVRFSRVQFSRSATFTATRFTADARFGGADFARATFDGAQFDDVAWFEGTRWRGTGSFEGAAFGRVAWFAGSRFDGTITFDRSSFAGQASFDHAAFQGRASFAKSAFHGLVVFMEAVFTDEADFGHITAKQEIRFNRSEFRAEARFNRAHFDKLAWLEDITVRGQAHFESARFADQVYVAGASFEGGLWLGQADFTAAHELGWFDAGPWLVLDHAIFQQRVRVHTQAERVAAVDARLLNGGDLRFVGAEVVLDGATFGAPTNVVGMQPDGGAGGRTRLLSLRRVDVTSLTLVDVDLAAGVFDGAHHLDQLRIEGSGPFASSPPSRPLRMGRLRVPLSTRRTRRQTLAEEHRWRADRAGTGRTGGPQWNPPETRPPHWVAEHTGHPVAVVPPHRIAAIYRALRKANEDAKNEPGAADFYYGEMEMRRHSRVTPAAERLLLHLYWLVSGYGLRAWRAGLLLLTVLGAHGFLFAAYGFVTVPGAEGLNYGSWSGHLYALNMLLFTPDAAVELTLIGEILRITLRVAGPVLLGLAVLAVRSRVKR